MFWAVVSLMLDESLFLNILGLNLQVSIAGSHLTVNSC